MKLIQKERIVGILVLLSLMAGLLTWMVKRSHFPEFLLKSQSKVIAPVAEKSSVSENTEAPVVEGIKAVKEEIFEKVDKTEKIEPPVSPKKAPPPIRESLRSGWQVQVGVFSDHQRARGLALQLKQKGYRVHEHEEKISKGGHVVRVYVGPFSREAEAHEVAQVLMKQLKIKGFLVKI